MPTTPACPIRHQRYLDLPSALYEVEEPTAFPSATLLALNLPLLSDMNIAPQWFQSKAGLAALSGNAPYGQTPVAMAYGGHQFGHWVPLLGDGRAHLLGQMTDGQGRLIDVQLKGSGRTRFSRGGDGRATLGSVLREYMVSEAMAGLGIPTTRAIAVIGTGETVLRESALPGAILARSALSHIRVGSFQFASASLGDEGVKALADFVIQTDFPACQDVPDKYAALLEAVIERQANLIAQWMLVGFIHGVMNTDNMSIVGETIDFGPCAFLDEFHPQKVFSSIDRHGRYAWDQQPTIALWNLTQFAGALLPLLNTDPAQAEAEARSRLDTFSVGFHRAFETGMRHKLGIEDSVATQDIKAFSQDTLTVMAEDGIDFTVFFDALTGAAESGENARLLGLFSDPEKAATWLVQWQALRSHSPTAMASMRRANPAVIARNHQVEAAITAAVEHEDLDPFRRLCQVLANPYAIDAADADLQIPPKPEERVTQTFCGT